MASLDLIAAYGFYLVALFATSVALRFSHSLQMVRFIAHFRSRWPNLAEVVNARRGVLVQLPTVLFFLAYIVLLIGHFLARFVLYPEAVLGSSTLLGSPGALFGVAGIGAAMLAVDVRIILEGRGPDPEGLALRLTAVEAGLRVVWVPAQRGSLAGTWFGRAIRSWVLGRVDRRLLSLVWELNRWLGWRALQLLLQLAFGLSLWTAWATL